MIEDKKAAVADADLLVPPSRYENFATPAAEAMACGVPMIVTQSCGIQSLEDAHAELVIAPEKEALVQALGKMLCEPSLYARMKDACRRVAAELFWDRRTAQIKHCYAEVLADAAGAY